MVNEKRIQHLLEVHSEFPNALHHQTSSVQQLVSRLTFELVCEWRYTAFHGYDTALFVSYVTRLSTVTIQPCLWVTSSDFPLLRYSFVCELCYQAFHDYDTAVFVSDAIRLSTVTIQLFCELCYQAFHGYDIAFLWVILPGFPRLRYSCVCDVTRLSLFVWLPQNINEQHVTYDSTSGQQESISWNINFLMPQCWRQHVNTFGLSHETLTYNHTKNPTVPFDRLLHKFHPDFH
jgi:hypothetical protein